MAIFLSVTVLGKAYSLEMQSLGSEGCSDMKMEQMDHDSNSDTAMTHKADESTNSSKSDCLICLCQHCTVTTQTEFVKESYLISLVKPNLFEDLNISIPQKGVPERPPQV